MTKQMKFGLVMLATAVLSVASLVNARGWVQNGSDWYYTDNSGDFLQETIQASGNSKFYLGETGAMERDFFLEDYNGATYYFGSNGAMVTNTWVAIDSSMVENQTDYVPDAYWYYFGSNGKALKGKSTLKPKTIDGKKYIFNENGQMCTGWVKEDSGTVNTDEDSNPFADALYYCGGDNDGVVREGWVSYYDGYDADDDDYRGELTTLYFYFGNNGKKVYATDLNAKTKNINGRTYAFNEEGIMYSGWDAYEQSEKWTTKPVYFSGEDDGHMVKKGWVYAVPGEQVDSKAFDEDEEKYMYFANNGFMYRDTIKKINGKYYIFDDHGIMQTGLVLWSVEGVDNSGVTVHYVKKADLDVAEGAEATKKGIFRHGDGATDFIQLNWDGTESTGTYHTVKLHYFGSDGARRIGSNVIEFSDNNYTFVSKNSGNYNSGVTKKKYYSLGFLCVADADLKYGLYADVANATDVPTPLAAQSSAGTGGTLAGTKFSEACNVVVTSPTAIPGGYTVLGTSGSKVKGSNTAKKDADGNYWLIDNTTGYLVGIYTVPVKYGTQTIKFKSQFAPHFDKYTDGTGKTIYLTEDTKSKTKSGNFDTYMKPSELVGFAIKGSATATFGGSEVQGSSYIDVSGTSVDFDQFTDNNFTITKYKWSSVSKSTGSIYNYLQITGEGYWFQSDYDGNSNKWLPVGIKDQAMSTAHVYDYTPMYYSSATDKNLTNQTYSVCPDDTYFLNCYWEERL